MSESFNVERGLRQGDPISPILFNLVLKWVMRESKILTSGLIYHQRHQILAYADDIAVLTRSIEELVDICKTLIRVARKTGLKINESKTKFMQVGGYPVNRLTIRIENEEYNFEEVQNFSYLGVSLSSTNDEEEEIATRIAKGSRCVGAVYHILKSNKVSRSAKLRIYKTVIRPTVLYGCELWAMKTTDKVKLEVWERKTLRKIFGGKKENELIVRRTNAEVMNLFGDSNITCFIRAQRLRWLGHIVHMP